MVVGREGPTIQLGGSLGKMVGEFGQFKTDKQNYLVAGGSAAGLAVAFNAPIAGVLFFIEELREHCKFCFSSFISVLLCCIVATIVYRAILGQGAVINMPVFSAPPLGSVVLFFVFGVLVGLIGLLFNLRLMWWLTFLDKQAVQFKRVYLIVVGILVAVMSIHLPEAVGGGYHILGHALNFSLVTKYLLFMLVIRFVLTILCYSTGVPGGIFAPMLAIGALAGLVFSKLLTFFGISFGISADMLAVAGMGGIFTASIRAPMTGILLIIEMTQNYFLILPSMVTCLTAFLVVELTKNPPIYASLLARTKRLAKRKGEQ
jgi:CIC family chloride channel protein